MNIGIYIYDNAEVLDFSGPYEVFSVANRFLKEKHNLFFISEKDEVVKARGEYKVLSDYTIKSHPKLDVLIVVGGVHTAELEKQNVIDWIFQQTKTAKLIASVCTGIFLLAKAKVVINHSVTTHWEDIEDLKNSFPALKVKENIRWVDEGDIVSSAGISAGIDMSLHLVSKLYNEKLALKTAKQMQFDWKKN
ncbi:DJ-1/PfpI family protein [Halarcobacter bivalviorum]|uniref:GATase1_PfpI_2 domain-containing protein n=1 Tax=Halarcobacter bivalviorum TaxID=663364 RepID=A0AAX2A4H3_9BACT|nr:DJ-1/PfpI family protein [Halarcobacter bivalviorum]AXH12804.1 GATase1_PfpI_2 domain-containing protein [Halarcobacter bivalviorum]RXK09072.1 glutamine amidotransferase [Halarcobacter bivalviorum]